MGEGVDARVGRDGEAADDGGVEGGEGYGGGWVWAAVGEAMAAEATAAGGCGLGRRRVSLSSNSRYISNLFRVS